MRKKEKIASDIISGIDDEIIEKNLIKRFQLWMPPTKKPKNNRWIPIVAAAACFCILLTTIFLLLPTGKQVPVYLGMTASSEAPVVSASVERANDYETLSLHSGSMLKATPILLKNDNGNHFGNNKGDSSGGATPEISGGPYYAMPGEDIYIYVHISNPDKFEILSFTLNGTKYSSYMFEAGSDLETLILKCNVGDVEGVMQYTIDAIKYVDGEDIKDVKMEGDRTIEVIVGRAESSLGFEISLSGFDVNITPVWDEEFTGAKEILTLGVYDGETLIKECSPDDRVISGLPNSSRLVLVATYKNGEITETSRHIFDTRKPSEGLLRSSGVITGIGTCQDTVLYLDAPIGEDAFSGNKYITEVYFAPGVTFIDNNAFKGCTGLKEIVIPNTVTSLGEALFSGCSGLTSVTLPDSLTTIGNSMFSGCESLTEVSIPDRVTIIGNYAFGNCESLSEVYIPNNVTSIGDYAFRYCNKLTNIVIPDNVTGIGSGAFSGCTSLTEITISDKVTSIGDYAFSYCDKLTNIVIPDNVTGIGSRAFSGCTSLTEITIPDKVTSIGSEAFFGCTNVQSVYITDIKAWCNIDFAMESEGDSYANPLARGAKLYLNGELLTDVVIPDGVESIKQVALIRLNGTLTLPKSIKRIEDYAWLDFSTIIFDGTHAEWNAIYKGYFAFSNPLRQYVKCTDETFTIQSRPSLD